MKNFLFNSGNHKAMASFALLVLRASFGLMMIVHGWDKLAHYNSYASGFPDPLHIGNEFSFWLVVFAEFFCAILIVLGLMTRFAAIPLIIAMAVVAFVINIKEPFADRELSMLYLSAYLAILIFGAGSYSLDKAISGK
ncbi:MAG TPA: DoxX family protein [Bacteroidales bacterium]|mgnify:CR=1 FL=1|jgi:putative oxidoreductase|nr:DoxX family protein [Bacteroidales bacterium]MDX9906457.1 DoxX family protein [Bacteroidales bacterium]HOX79192.1 DoxX family protein [Bacteroidales bacterium]HPI86992.1 DoxX family protein [Bacteroidales bacterium]HPM93344.1 DoxX family protein [Bacteroidales bacterium]